MKNSKKIDVAVLGATGIIGQVFVHILSTHNLFRIGSLIASKKRTGKKYGDETDWHLPFPGNENIKNTVLEKFDIKDLRSKGIRYIFSALPADRGEDMEPYLRENGFFVFSNSAAHRRDPNVPILIPEVNAQDMSLINKQGFPNNGFIVTNPNCSTSGLVLSLSSFREFGIEEVTVSTYQAISGAGIPGLSAMEINDNVLPYIRGEEEKIEFETKKILGINTNIFATCVRVPVRFGHFETVWIKLKKIPDKELLLKKWESTTQFPNLSSCPDRPIEYLSDPNFPKNDLAFFGSPPGMQVFTGGLRIKGEKIGFNLFVNNVIRGGAGGSIANAELFNSVFGGH